MPTGEVSGIDVVDEDPRNGGNLDDLGDVPMAVVAWTRSGGRHIFLQHRPGNKSAALRSGIDLKSTGGYVILWGDTDEGECLSGDLLGDLPEYPDWLKKGPVLRSSAINTAEIRKGVPKGSRNDSIFRAVCSYRALNLAR